MLARRNVQQIKTGKTMLGTQCIGHPPAYSGEPQRSYVLPARESAVTTDSDAGKCRKRSTGPGDRPSRRQPSRIKPDVLKEDRGSSRQRHRAPALPVSRTATSARADPALQARCKTTPAACTTSSATTKPPHSKRRRHRRVSRAMRGASRYAPGMSDVQPDLAGVPQEVGQVRIPMSQDGLVI